MAIPEYDVVLIGAGFGSIAALARLRKLGFKCRIFEKGSRSGGIWYWNCYPGARVDSDAPIYQLFDREIYNEFEFKERYPDWKELRRYFDYLDTKLDLQKDTDYNKTLTAATFDESSHKWTCEFHDGSKAVCRFLVPAIGFAAKEFVPKYKNLDKFKGEMYHTAKWPQEGVDLKGKRIAVIGTGASGIQTIQEVGKEASEFTVYQRTPNYCLPMNQRSFKDGEINEWKSSGKFAADFEALTKTFAGFTYDFQDRKTFDDTPEEREKFFHKILVEEGGFRYWLNTYSDMLFDETANREAYNYWRDYVRSRIKDPRKQEIMAPTEPIHPWGTKRPSLEQHIYETISQDNCTLIDITADPIKEFTETGIITESGHQQDFDLIALATGFDAVTGSLSMIDIRGSKGESIADHWKDGLRTSMGIAMNEFPNMYFLYGPQAPTAFSNGPSCVQFQADWLANHLRQAKEAGFTRVEAKADVEKDWTRRTHEAWDGTLFPQAKSWYQGANIPGRKVEPLNWAGGMGPYLEALHESNKNDFQGWHTAQVGAA